MAINYNELITINSNGLSIANFTEVRDALISMYKEIYGNDIDVSTASADSQFVLNMSLIIYNMLEAVKTLYSSLDVNLASGKFLDRLCALSNIVRKEETKSNVSLAVTNDGTDAYGPVTSIVFVDKGGTTWSYNGAEITIAPNETISLTVTCDIPGKIVASPGYIDRTLQSTMLSVVQSNSANVGLNAETDYELLMRRNKSLGQSGTSTIDGLVGSLLAIEGIEDVLVYNNAEDTEKENEDGDGTNILPHSVYVCVRKNNAITIEDSVIGSLIYNKLTPGVRTTPYDSSEGVNGIAKSYSYDTGTSIIQTINWKQCVPIHPTIKVTIEPLSYFNANANGTCENIGNNIIDFANSLSINSKLTILDIINVVYDSDITFRGKRTFNSSMSNVKINEVNTDYSSQDTYFDYSSVTVSQSGNNYIVEIK